MRGMLKYSSNNSGGRWWLTDEDWYALERQGWKVHWEKAKERSEGERFLGALASSAEKKFDNKLEGIKEWEKLTGEYAGSIGCNCCGEPHSFRWDRDDGIVEWTSVRSPELGKLEFN